jgi:hypothetical protein
MVKTDGDEKTESSTGSEDDGTEGEADDWWIGSVTD